MYEFIRKAGISIPREYENEIWLDSIKRFLTRPSKVYGSQDQVELQKFYLETDKNIILPRFFPVEDYVNCKVIDKSQEGEIIDIEHNIKPKNKLQEKAIDYLQNNDSGTIELQPGTGKTVITIYDICERKRKPLILLYLYNLATQWKERFIEHTNLNEDDILIVKSNNFEKMKNYKCLIITNQTFLSLLKSKPIEFLTELNNANIGIFISDECHTATGAKTFSQCSLNVPSKIVRGLSATPYRADGNHDIIEYHTGPIFKDESYEGTNTNVTCTFILLDYGIDQPRRKRYLYWGGNFNRARYLNLMVNPKHCPRFHSVVKGLLDKFKDDYHMLVISERNKLIDKLYDWVDCDDKSKFNKNEGLDKLNNRVTFSSPGKIRDGVDAPWKELIILTSPISNIKQMTGRVCRDYEGKDKVRIIDIIDIGCSYVRNQMKKRREYYKNNNWNINYLVVDLDLNLNKISESEAEELMENI
ncbi:MAG: DEAD/DEAH box helicase [bacterium]